MAAAARAAPSRGARALRAAGWATLGLGAAGAGAYYKFKAEFGKEFLPRTVRAYSVAIPAYIQYRAVAWWHEHLPARLGLPPRSAEADAAYAELHETWAPRMLELILELRGFNLKTGQMVASDFAGIAPKRWQELFAPLLDAVPPKPFDEVRAIVEADLGVPLEAVYAWFDPAPLASASVAQVHRATLPDGTAVVVKVQHPEAERLFRGDVAMSKAFAQVALPEHVPALKEIEAQFATEFNFAAEAENLTLVRGNLGRDPAWADILVPRPITRLCTRRVLTMTEIPGALKLTDALRQDMGAHAAARGVTLEVLLAEEDAANAAALARGELRCGPDATTMGRYISALQWRNGLAWLTGGTPVRVPRNHAALVDRLMAVHGHQALVDGAVNGDPQPANLLLSSDGRGGERLALVDFGQVKRLGTPARLALARLVLALAAADEANPAHRRAVAAYAVASGMRTARCDPDVMFRYTQLFFDRDDKLLTRGAHVQAYLEALNDVDKMTGVVDDYVLVGRASMMLRGLGHLLNQHRRAAVAWAPAAERALREAGERTDDILTRVTWPPPELVAERGAAWAAAQAAASAAVAPEAASAPASAGGGSSASQVVSGRLR